MNLRQFASVLVGVAVLTGPLAAIADATGPRRAMTVGNPSTVEPAGATSSARVGLIFSNFDKPTTAFQRGGFVVAGPANSSGFGKQFVAAPFVPKQNATLTSVAIAVNHGADASMQMGVVVKLYADIGGIPGSLISSWPVAVVADYIDGNFSYLAIATDSAGIPLTSGSTYWVAVETDANSDFYGQWESNTSRGSGIMAYWNDSVANWVPYTFAVPALAVYGKVF